jgi:hypothetical protein
VIGEEQLAEGSARSSELVRDTAGFEADHRITAALRFIGVDPAAAWHEMEEHWRAATEYEAQGVTEWAFKGGFIVGLQIGVFAARAERAEQEGPHAA